MMDRNCVPASGSQTGVHKPLENHERNDEKQRIKYISKQQQQQFIKIVKITNIL